VEDYADSAASLQGEGAEEAGPGPLPRCGSGARAAAVARVLACFMAAMLCSLQSQPDAVPLGPLARLLQALAPLLHESPAPLRRGAGSVDAGRPGADQARILRKATG